VYDADVRLRGCISTQQRIAANESANELQQMKYSNAAAPRIQAAAFF
jgi:hypothetical protein